MKTEKAIEIGERLKELRGIRTRAGVAKAIDVSYNSLTNYENGFRIPPDEVKIRLANYYGKTVQEIFFTNQNYEK